MTNQKGFGAIEVLVGIVVIGILGFGAWMFFSNPKENDSANQKTSTPAPTYAQQEANHEDTMHEEQHEKQLLWHQSMDGWTAMGDIPECEDQPMLTAPADISKVTAVLYPGQTRGGNYKTHGGLRFDNSPGNQITLKAPLDGFIVRGGSNNAEGEIQYTFDIMNNCGIMYRVGHIRELPANLQAIADTWPAPSANSATQSVNPPVFVEQGATLGTKVGILKTNNTFFDMGVYDYRKQNEASQSASYQAQHQKELAWHAVCWLQGWLPTEDEAKLTSLPAGDPASAKQSDYCN